MVGFRQIYSKIIFKQRMMKKRILLLAFATVVMMQSFAQIVLQGRTVPESLVERVMNLGQSTLLPPNAESFTFDQVLNWIGEGENEAALVVQWNVESEKNAYVWGYRWSGTATGADMVMAIADADPRFCAMVSEGAYGLTIGGLGYDVNGSGNFTLSKGGADYPVGDNGLIIEKTGTFEGFLPKDSQDWWQSGWNNGFWSLWVSEKADFSGLKFASTGASGRQLINGSIDAWNFSVGMVSQNWKALQGAPGAERRPDKDGFYMLNEGWFGHDNGSISWISSSGSITYNVDKAANSGESKLGLTSCYGQIYGDVLYVSSKQGNRFAMFDADRMSCLAKLESIGGDGRALLNVGNDKVYLGTSAGISVYDITSGKIKKTVFGMSEGPNTQVGSMARIGNCVFASQQGVGLQIIDVEKDLVVKTINQPACSGLVVSKDGYVWLVARDKLLRVDPVTFETSEVVLPNSIASQWGSWKPDQICADYQENVLYYAYGSGWSQTKLGKLRINQDGSVVEDTAFRFVMPEGVSQPQEFYGVLRVDPHTGYIVVSTIQSGWGDNYSYNWIHLVNPQTGDIVRTIEVNDENGKNYYWFPALPIFPDIAEPLVTLEDMQFGTATPMLFHVSDFVSDSDNLSVLAEVEVWVDDPSIATVEFDGINLTVTPLSQGETRLTVKVNSNGKLSEKSVRLSVDDLSSVDGSAAADLSVFPTLVLDHVKVNGNGICRMSVYNLFGTKMIDRMVDGGEMVDMSNLPSGTYIVKVQSGSTVVTQKIVKR